MQTLWRLMAVGASLIVLTGNAGVARAQPLIKLTGLFQLPSTGKGEFSQPLAEGSILYFGISDGWVMAFDADRRVVIWRTAVEEGVESTPSLDRESGTLYVGTTGGRVLALRAADGSRIWDRAVLGQNNAQPLVDGPRLIVANGQDRVVALQRADGAWLWEYRRTLLGNPPKVKGMSSPARVGDRIVAGFSDGTVAALNPETGQPIWEQRVGTKRSFGDADTAPLEHAGLIWMSCFDDRLVGLDPSSGKTVVSTVQGTHQSLVLYEARLLLSDPRPGMAALDPVQSATPVWDRFLDEYVYGFAIQGDWVVGTTADGKVALYDPSSGALLDAYDCDSRYNQPPVAWEGGVAAISATGWLYLLAVRGR